MLWVKSFHIISMVAWFAGLFYLPRLFVYHAECQDDISNQRFKVMERRLFNAIMTPAGIATTVFGLWLLSYNIKGYMQAGWMHAKLGLVVLLWVYHMMSGLYLRRFANDSNNKSALFFRCYNEVSTVFLLGIVILVVVKPF